MPRIDAVIFDLDDTLLDWSQQTEPIDTLERPHVENMYAYLTAVGHSMPARDTFFQCYRSTILAHWQRAKQDFSGVNFGQVLCDCLTTLGVDAGQVDLLALMQAYEVGSLPGVLPFPDAHAVLDTLDGRGYKLGLVTNSMMPMWMRDVELRNHNLLRYFDARITSGDTGVMKPHPDIYYRITDLLDTLPEHAMFVGDRPANDIAGANAVGMVSVLMSPPHLDRELNGVQPDYIIASLSELLPILETFGPPRAG